MATSNDEQPVTERHRRGKLHLVAMINYWLGLNGLNQYQMANVVAWGLGQGGLIQHSYVSRFKASKFARGVSWDKLDAMAAANVAIWTWQVKGQAAARKAYGPPSSWSVKDQELDDATWLPHPEHPDQPLRFQDWAAVQAGYMTLPYLGTAALSPSLVRTAGDRLADLLDQAAADRGWGVREAIEQMLQAYPVSDKARQRRLRRVITGELRLDREELEEEMYPIAEMIRVIRGLPAGGYGRVELQGELLSESHPSP